MYLLIFLFIRHTIHVFISFKWLLKLRSIQVKSKAWYYNICFTIFCRSTSDLPKLLKDMLKEHCRQQDGKQHLCTCVQYRINSPSYVTRYVHAAVNTSTISQAGAYLCCNRPSFYKYHLDCKMKTYFFMPYYLQTKSSLVFIRRQQIIRRSIQILRFLGTLQIDPPLPPRE